MTSLTFYGAVNEIGGNKILLETGSRNIMFDFGIPYGRRGEFFEEFLKPRAVAGMRDLFELDLVPPLKGVYREDLLQPEDWKRIENRPGYREVNLDGIVLSHAHLDHSGYISFLKESIPVVSSLVTAVLSKAIQDTSPADFEKEVCYIAPREFKDGVYQSARKVAAVQRPFRVFCQGAISEEVHQFWGDIPASKGLDCCPLTDPGPVCGNMKQFPVDHSIFGASSFIVETPAGPVCYTGDLRVHGSGAHLTEAFAAEAAKLHPRIMMCEGTRIDSSKRITEEEVYARALKIVQGSKGLVLADFGPRNIERLLIFYRIAIETGRQLVVMGKDAYILDKLGMVMPEVPGITKMPSLGIYKEPKALVSTWEKGLREQFASRLVTLEQLRDKQKDYILCFSFWDVNDLVDLRPVNGTYIYSSSEVYDEEGAMDMTRLHNWVKHFKLNQCGIPVPVTDSAGKPDWLVPLDQQGLHASGHASGPELLEIIRRIKPDILIPIHTEHPGMFVEALEGTGIEVRLPGYGVRMKV